SLRGVACDRRTIRSLEAIFRLLVAGCRLCVGKAAMPSFFQPTTNHPQPTLTVIGTPPSRDTIVREETTMPMHDWTRVAAGIYHDFHHEWISAIKQALNAVLPGTYYALA